MSFNEKLNLLMTITNTTNSALAHSVSLDASFISRLRRGIRFPSKNENYINSMALFFARNISKEYQRAAICDALSIPPENFPDEVEFLSEIISKWLYSQAFPETNKVQGFIDTLTRSDQNRKPIISNLHMENCEKTTNAEGFVYYGVEGKRNASLNFLSLVAKNKKPQTLLLFSDEDLEWLTSNKEFVTKWAFLLAQVIAKGNRIKIIHTVSRDLHEMLSAVEEWLPMYMTGAIEPYYYPKKRDGVFQRTLFIAPETAAVISNSVIKKTDYSANFLFTDRKTILAFAAEFNDYLSLCRPLMKIFTPAVSENFLSTLWEFECEGSDTYVATDTLTNITMPPEVFNSLCSRTNCKNKIELSAKQELRVRSFENSLQKYSFTKILNIPDLETIRNGKARVGFSDMFSEGELFYNVDEFIDHLDNIIQLLKVYENFHVILETNSKISGCMIYVKEDVGVMISKNSMPSVMFAINESNLTAAFWDYMNTITTNSARDTSTKANTIAELEKIKETLLC